MQVDTIGRVSARRQAGRFFIGLAVTQWLGKKLYRPRRSAKEVRHG
jgi:hypothetical protein